MAMECDSGSESSVTVGALFLEGVEFSSSTLCAEGVRLQLTIKCGSVGTVFGKRCVSSGTHLGAKSMR